MILAEVYEVKKKWWPFFFFFFLCVWKKDEKKTRRPRKAAIFYILLFFFSTKASTATKRTCRYNTYMTSTTRFLFAGGGWWGLFLFHCVLHIFCLSWITDHHLLLYSPPRHERGLVYIYTYIMIQTEPDVTQDVYELVHGPEMNEWFLLSINSINSPYSWGFHTTWAGFTSTLCCEYSCIQRYDTRIQV